MWIMFSACPHGNTWALSLRGKVVMKVKQTRTPRCTYILLSENNPKDEHGRETKQEIMHYPVLEERTIHLRGQRNRLATELGVSLTLALVGSKLYPLLSQNLFGGTIKMKIFNGMKREKIQTCENESISCKLHIVSL